MRKKERHHFIQRLLSEYDIQRQEDFVEVLKSRGVEVTQATISRDIKEMQLIKVPATHGGYRYSLPVDTANQNLENRMTRLLRDAFLSADTMEKFVVLRTLPGNASALGGLIEKNYFDCLFTVLSTDENILMICRTEKDARKLYDELLSFI